jgi:enoyl-CoA hydratase/carnithine racemase
MNDGLIDQLITELHALARDPACRLIVIRGQGGVFSAGRELNDLRKLQGATLDDITAAYERLHELNRAFHDCPVPTLAVIERFAFGAGATILSWCDMALAEDSAFVCYPELQHGIVPAPALMGLLRSVPEKLAMELLLTGRRVYGPEAARIGLITRSVDPEELETALGELIDGVCRGSITTTRRLLRFKNAAEAMSPREAMAEAVHSISTGLLDDESRRRIAAFLDKQPIA